MFDWKAFLQQHLIVSIPKKLHIQNRRLAIWFRVLQVANLLGLLIYCVASESWREFHVPTGVLLLTCVSPNVTAMANNYPTFCQDLASYQFVTQDFNAKPTRCVALSSLESCMLQDDQMPFVPTFSKQQLQWQGAGSSCDASAQSWCKNASNSQYAKSGESCSCTINDAYLSQTADEQIIVVRHEYEADFSNGARTRTVGISGDGVVTEVSNGKQLSYPGEIFTVVQGPRGETCTLGGKSEWAQSGAQLGIGAPLKEWLSCAGMGLDANPAVNDESTALPRHVRLMGMRLLFHFHYTNKYTGRFDKVACYLTVYAYPEVRRRRSLDFVEFPVPGSSNSRAFLSLTSYGVSVQTEVTGQFWVFHFEGMVTIMVQSVVILQFPLIIVQFIALYCLGITSETYRNAKFTKLDLFRHFHTGIARMILAEMGFRGLLGGVWKGCVSQLTLTRQGLFAHMCDVFDVHMKSGMLDVDELRRMVAVTFKQLDVKDTGSITCNEFIDSCMEGDMVTSSNMAKFFDDDQRVSILRRIFDSTWNQRNSALNHYREARISKDLTVELNLCEAANAGGAPCESSEAIPERTLPPLSSQEGPQPQDQEKAQAAPQSRVERQEAELALRVAVLEVRTVALEELLERAQAAPQSRVEREAAELARRLAALEARTAALQEPRVERQGAGAEVEGSTGGVRMGDVLELVSKTKELVDVVTPIQQKMQLHLSSMQEELQLKLLRMAEVLKLQFESLIDERLQAIETPEQRQGLSAMALPSAGLPRERRTRPTPAAQGVQDRPRVGAASYSVAFDTSPLTPCVRSLGTRPALGERPVRRSSRGQSRGENPAPQCTDAQRPDELHFSNGGLSIQSNNI